MRVLAKVLNKRVVAVDSCAIYFENGLKIEFNPYETYMSKCDLSLLKRGDVDYFSPRYVKEVAE